MLVKQVALARNVSMAYVMREAISSYFSDHITVSSKKKYDLLDLVGSLSGGPRDFSSNISKHLKKLYQEKKA